MIRQVYIHPYKLWQELYPRDLTPVNNLSRAYQITGQIDSAIAAAQQALRLDPKHVAPYGALAKSYQFASRFAEAKAICEKAASVKLDSTNTHQVLYAIAAAEQDEPAMQREVAWAKGKPSEAVSLYYQARVAAGLGHIRDARKLFDAARALAMKSGLKEQGTAMTNDQAQVEVELGYPSEARRLADLAFRASADSARHKTYAAISLARSGEVQRPEAVWNEVSKMPLLGTSMTEVVLPGLRSAVDLSRKNPAAAVEDLRSSIPYDLGTESSGWNPYYRGLAYLELKSGKEAAEQFQKVLDNHGVVTTGECWPLARLGLARAYAQTGGTEKSLAAYRDLLAYWKSADADLPPLKQAKAEYKKLSEHAAQGR